MNDDLVMALNNLAHAIAMQTDAIGALVESNAALIEAMADDGDDGDDGVGCQYLSGDDE